MTNQAIDELVEQVDRLAGYVKHHGEAARDGVPVSGDHLVYLGESLRRSAEQLGSAIQDQEIEAQRRSEAFEASIAGRNADLINRTLTGMRRTADHISRIQLGEMYSFDANGRVYMQSPAIGLIEWFYAMNGPKTVRTRVEDGFAWVSVEGAVDGDELYAWTDYRSDEARALITACQEPSVHLLRRLQIAGAL